MSLVLSASDLLIVTRTTENVSAEALPRLIRIHEKSINLAEERRAGLLREVEAIDRAIAMRRASLVALTAAQTGRSEILHSDSEVCLDREQSGRSPQ